MTLRRLSAVCVLAAALLLPVSHVAAQMGLPREVIAAEAIGPGQAAEIGRYADEWAGRLGSDDPLEIKRVRDNLLLPLRERNVSVAFRQAYAERLLPELRNHVRDERDLVIFNALRIAGELATPGSIDVLRDQLRDARPSVRYAAVYGMDRIFATIASEQSPAMGSAAVEQLLNNLGRHLENEQESKVFDAGIRALATAMQIERQNYGHVRPLAFSTLARISSERTKNLDGGPGSAEMLRVLLRSGQIARDVLSVANPRQQLSEQGVREAAELSGHLLAYIVRRLQAGDFPHDEPEARSLAGQVVTVAETSIVLATRTPQAPNLMGDFSRATQESDRAFFSKAVDLLGLLTRPPFGFPAGHFLGN
jgi:hypothetical protein